MAWAGARVWFLIRRPHIRATAVLVHWEGRVLLLSQSYRSSPSFPGGMLKRSEDPIDGALREIGEEIGLRPEPEALRLLRVLPQQKWGATIDLHCFGLHLVEEPAIEIDRREVVAAHFLPLSEVALALPEFVPLLERLAEIDDEPLW
jgi:8-oxo-dGTP pyrophosphatase MutT (NUDIX family)